MTLVYSEKNELLESGYWILQCSSICLNELIFRNAMSCVFFFFFEGVPKKKKLRTYI